MGPRTKWSFVGASVVAVAFGLWFDKAANVTALVTTAYVIVVFLQLEMMKRQHESELSYRREMARGAESRLPRLTFSEICVRRTTESDRNRGVDLGPAWYVNCTVKNVGGTIANRAQPVLTAMAERLPNQRWRLVPDWISLGLRWSLDELNVSQGQPTQERYLVPNRPYMFDLGKLSAYLPQRRFDLSTLLKPNAQKNDFGVGEYCFEVTLYSENADPVSVWYLVRVEGDIHFPNPLNVEQLTAAPWAGLTHSTAPLPG
jgi:hypothetical protein